MDHWESEGREGSCVSVGPSFWKSTVTFSNALLVSDPLAKRGMRQDRHWYTINDIPDWSQLVIGTGHTTKIQDGYHLFIVAPLFMGRPIDIEGNSIIRKCLLIYLMV